MCTQGMRGAGREVAILEKSGYFTALDINFELLLSDFGFGVALSLRKIL